MMGGFYFASFETPCPVCHEAKVEYAWFAGDHWDYPSTSIKCKNCRTEFTAETWDKYTGNEKPKETARGGPRYG